jgi:hypothetical protein
LAVHLEKLQLVVHLATGSFALHFLFPQWQTVTKHFCCVSYRIITYQTWPSANRLCWC